MGFLAQVLDPMEAAQVLDPTEAASGFGANKRRPSLGVHGSRTQDLDMIYANATSG